LGDLIKRQNEEANEAPAADERSSHATPKKAQKAYGAKDRQALDRLFETTGGSGKQ
jgi:hypothetical protein